MKCIVIEDEPTSREIIEDYIGKTSTLNLMSVFTDAVSAGDFILQNQVDVIFLDINLPGLNGVLFFKSLVNPPMVIFTTAYPEYAVDGFDLNAIDYLLKPYSFERFLRAVNKAYSIFNQEKPVDKAYLFLKSNKKIHKVFIEDILFLEALGDYVKVHSRNKMLIVHDRLSALKEQLPSNNFIQTHKSFVISLNNFDFIEGNSIRIGTKSIPISHTYKNDLLERIKN